MIKTTNTGLKQPFPAGRWTTPQPTQAAIVTSLWHCHDGWANSIIIVTAGKVNETLADTIRAEFGPLWYRSANTKESAEARLAKKIALARTHLPDAPTIEDGSAEHLALFAKGGAR